MEITKEQIGLQVLQGPWAQEFIIYPYIGPVAQAKNKDLPEGENSSSKETVLMNKKVGFGHNSSREYAKDESVFGQAKPRS